MKAVLADLSTQRYLLTRAAQHVPRGRGKSVGWGPGGLLRLVDDLPTPALPDSPGWVRLRPELAGICGSDIGLAHAKLSFVLSAFYTAERQIPGHEVVAEVTDCGPGVSRVAPGDRVAVTPFLSCAQRAIDPPCRACADGRPDVCERFDLPGAIGCTGASIGFEARVGGGWGQQLVAHESQLFPVGELASRRAVLAEPASVALHAVLRWQRSGDRAVVIGAGTVGLLIVAGLRMVHPDLDIIALTNSEFSSEHALKAGASRVLPSEGRAVQMLAESDGGRLLRPRMTRTPILEQGVDVVFDAVASAETIDLGLHLLRSSGAFVMVGSAGQQSVDWSLLWNRGLTMFGTCNFGPERTLGGRHTMAQVVEWLHDPGYRVDGLVTHTFGIDRWRQAMDTASAGPSAECVKVTLRPNLEVALVE